MNKQNLIFGALALVQSFSLAAAADCNPVNDPTCKRVNDYRFDLNFPDVDLNISIDGDRISKKLVESNKIATDQYNNLSGALMQGQVVVTCPLKETWLGKIDNAIHGVPYSLKGKTKQEYFVLGKYEVSDLRLSRNEGDLWRTKISLSNYSSKIRNTEILKCRDGYATVPELHFLVKNFSLITDDGPIGIGSEQGLLSGQANYISQSNSKAVSFSDPNKLVGAPIGTEIIDYGVAGNDFLIGIGRLMLAPENYIVAGSCSGNSARSLHRKLEANLELRDIIVPPKPELPASVAPVAPPCTCISEVFTLTTTTITTTTFIAQRCSIGAAP